MLTCAHGRAAENRSDVMRRLPTETPLIDAVNSASQRNTWATKLYVSRFDRWSPEGHLQYVGSSLFYRPRHNDVQHGAWLGRRTRRRAVMPSPAVQRRRAAPDLPGTQPAAGPQLIVQPWDSSKNDCPGGT